MFRYIAPRPLLLLILQFSSHCLLCTTTNSFDPSTGTSWRRLQGEAESRENPIVNAVTIESTTPPPTAEKQEGPASDKVEKLEAELAQVKKDNAALKDRIAQDTLSLTAKLEKEVAQGALLEKEVASHKTRGDSLEKQVALQKETLDKCHESRKSKDKMNDELTQSLEQTKASLEQKSSSMDALTDKLNKLTEQMTAKVSEVAQLQEQTRANQRTISELQSKHEMIQTNYTQLEKMYADPSVQHFLERKALKLYRDPGIEGAANKTFVYVLPSLRQRYVNGQELVNQSTAFIYSKLNAFIGREEVEPWLPFASGILVYGSIVLPFTCAVCCLMKIMCRRRMCLLFCHLYFMFSCLCAEAFAIATGKDPLTAFADHDAAVYLFAQILIGGMLLVYASLLFTAWCFCPERGSKERWYRLLQLVGITPIILGYYWYVWTPAMLDKMPQLDEMVVAVVGHRAWTSLMWLPYAPPSIVFLLALSVEVLALGASSGSIKQQVSVDMRDVSELASLIGKEEGIELGHKSS